MRTPTIAALVLFAAVSVLGGVYPKAAPTTTNNDDTCDIAVTPAATLLLPEFEVETAAHTADTLFTITNVSRLPQIARVTIWTDWGYPALTFNLFLTGYDVQALSLYDILVNGAIAPTSSNTNPGRISLGNSANPNLSTASCANLPGSIPAPARAAVVSLLTTGIAPGGACGTTPVGSPARYHPTKTTAVGFVTVDVVAVCATESPADAHYFDQQLLFDNVLTGDCELISRSGGVITSTGGPMVHIRAIPEGGPAGDDVPTSFPATFYDALTPPSTPHIDRRQPLPSVFAVRWNGLVDPYATESASRMTFWRGWASHSGAPCGDYEMNSSQVVLEAVRFDEHENFSTSNNSGLTFEGVPSSIETPMAFRTSTLSAGFPWIYNSPSGDSSGWMYINAAGNNGWPPRAYWYGWNYEPRRVQSWITYTIAPHWTFYSRKGSFAHETTATALGNGCSATVRVTIANRGTVIIGPLPNEEVGPRRRAVRK